ncbi:MAG: dodecin family protein [Bacteroidota bacterium]
MSIAKTIEVSSQSTKSFDDAAMNAVREAGRTIKNIKHVWVESFEIEVRDDGEHMYRTHCKVTFVIDHGDDVS